MLFMRALHCAQTRDRGVMATQSPILSGNESGNGGRVQIGGLPRDRAASQQIVGRDHPPWARRPVPRSWTDRTGKRWVAVAGRFMSALIERSARRVGEVEIAVGTRPPQSGSGA